MIYRRVAVSPPMHAVHSSERARCSRITALSDWSGVGLTACKARLRHREQLSPAARRARRRPVPLRAGLAEIPTQRTTGRLPARQSA